MLKCPFDHCWFVLNGNEISLHRTSWAIGTGVTETAMCISSVSLPFFSSAVKLCILADGITWPVLLNRHAYTATLTFYTRFRFHPVLCLFMTNVIHRWVTNKRKRLWLRYALGQHLLLLGFRYACSLREREKKHHCKSIQHYSDWWLSSYDNFIKL